MKEYLKMWKTPQGRDRIKAEIALSAAAVLIILLVVIGTSGASGGVLVGTPWQAEMQGGQQFYAYPCQNINYSIWWAEPTMSAGFRDNWCAYYERMLK